MSSKLLSSALVLGVLVLGVVEVAGAQPVWNEDFEFLRGDGTPGDRFGESAAASGNTVVFGAPDASTVGAAYVYVRDGSGVWTLQQKLLAGAGAAEFGRDVAIDGDTIVVGDTFADSQHGAAYVFTRSGSTWTQQVKLSASDAAIGDEIVNNACGCADSFGSSVAISGNTILVGANSAEVGTTWSVGAAYVYTRSGTTWTEQQKIPAPTLTPNTFFPSEAGLSGDRAVLGVRSHAPGGAAYVYQRSGGVFAQTFTIVPTGVATGDRFGEGLALQGDRLLVSALGDDNSAGVDAGAAYVFEYDGANWVQRAMLLPGVAVAGDGFGSVALDGDLAVIGSGGSDAFALNGGAAALFIRESDGDWINLSTLVSSDVQANWTFGSALAITGGSVIAGARYVTPRPPAPQVFVPGSAYEFVVGDLDFEPPDFTIPIDIMLVEATSSAGAVATFAFTATDDVDGEIEAVCAPPSGSMFGFGDTTVQCTATDAAGNASRDSFIVRVDDTTEPDAECTDVVKECTGPSTSVETSCTASDAVDDDPTLTSSAQASYPVSFNFYTCTAQDDHANIGSEQCTVQVTDTVPPTCVAPETGYVECTDEGGVSRGQAFVAQHLDQFEFDDLCDFAGTRTEGPLFLPAGCVEGLASTITITAIDGSDNETPCSTDVVVYDNRPPAITVPAPITLECDTTGGVAGDNGNITSWLAIASVFDRCHDETLTHNAPALFGVGQTVVVFTGVDTCGNTDANVSNVTVLDTGAPDATCQNTTVECTGALTPVTTSCGGSDLCDGSVAVASDAAPSYARGQHTFSCQAQDDSGNGDSASCLINVVDTTAAVIAPISTVTGPVAPGTNVTMSATFTAACGPHTGTWTFGDGTSGPATVSEGAGSGTASGSHIYTTPGTYTLTLTLTDASGNVATRTHQSIVVSAPPANQRGSVTGAGVIASPRGAIRAFPNSSGVASYTLAATHPIVGPFTPVAGVTTFSILLPTFSFTSLSVQALTINGANAKYNGTGRVNGSSGFSFLMTVVDGQRPGGGGFDRLHLKVWTTATGAVVYDNEPSVPDTAPATARITAGTIAILPF